MKDQDTLWSPEGHGPGLLVQAEEVQVVCCTLYAVPAVYSGISYSPDYRAAGTHLDQILRLVGDKPNYTIMYERDMNVKK